MYYRSFQTKIIDAATGKRAIYNSHDVLIMVVPLGWTDTQIATAIDEMLSERQIQLRRNR